MKPDQYKEKWKLIRHFFVDDIDLRRKLTTADKTRITKNYNKLKQFLRKDAKIYRPRNKNKINNLKKLYGVTGASAMKAFPVPKATEISPRIKFSGKNTIIRSDKISREYILIDPIDLAENPEGYIRDVLKNKRFSRCTFAVLGNDFFITADDADGLIKIYYNHILGRYDIKLITEIVLIRFKNQLTYDEFRAKRREKKNARKMRSKSNGKKNSRR